MPINDDHACRRLHGEEGGGGKEREIEEIDIRDGTFF